METVLRKIQDRIQENLHLKRLGGGAKFFSGTKRGEGSELATDLNSTDKDRQKNAVKRIIANMTLGRDVSQLFVEVVKLGQTLNVELKKLVYLYILNTAKLQPDKALMAVNTFLQDAVHASPIIRALAIRTMMCIRVECVTEYTLEPLRRAVTDVDPYVRKTAAIAIGKLFHQNSRIFLEQNFVAEVVRLLADPFPVVSSNAAMILCEVNAFSGCPVDVKTEWAQQLLNALPECSEWGQSYVMELLASYLPPNAEAADTLLARVVPRLAHTNPAVVMGAIKVIAAHAPRCSVDVNALYVPRINAALLTLAKADPETQYVVCKNVHMLLVLFPTLLQNNMDYFYIRFSDPPYVKIEKLRLLLKLTTAATADAIVKEFSVYSNEVDLVFVKEVVGAIAAVAIKVEAVGPRCATLLLDLLAKRPEVLPQVITASKNIVRKYPELLLLDSLLRDHGADSVVDEDAKVSLVWMLGEFCDFVENGAAVLQQFIETLMSQEQSVQLALLTAVVKVFLRNPQGMEATLNHVLETLTNHSMDPDIRDRAFAYWRLLSKGVGVESMKKIVHGRKPPVDVDRTFSDAMTIGEMRQAINTASAVYGKPYRTFLPAYGAADVEDGESDEDDGDVGPTTPAQSGPQATTTVQQPDLFPTAAPVPVTKPPTYVDPLDDIFAGPSVKQTITAAPTVVTAAVVPPAPARPNPSTAIDDIFGPTPPISTSAPVRSTVTASSPVTSSNLPPLAYEIAGVSYHVSVAVSPAPSLTVAIVNRGAIPVQQIVMQVNKSSYGFVPQIPLAERLSLQVIAPGQTAMGEVPMRVTESHFAAAKCTLEVALKSNLGLHIFPVSLSANTMMHTPPPALDRATFLQQWKSLDETCEAKTLLDRSVSSSMMALGTSGIKSKLEQAHCVVVAERASDEQLSIYGGCRTHYGLSALFEVVVRRDQSYVCCKSMRVNDVLPSVSSLIEAVFGSKDPVPAAQAPKPFSAADIFS